MMEFIFVLLLSLFMHSEPGILEFNSLTAVHIPIYKVYSVDIKSEASENTSAPETDSKEPTQTANPEEEIKGPEVTAAPAPASEAEGKADAINEDATTEDAEMNYVEELTKLGYIKDEYDDNNINVRNGVLRFQADSNLEADGIYGPLSTAALKKRVKERSFQYSDTVSSPPSDGYWIYINKSRRILTLYEGKNVVKKYPVAVGNPPSLTPEGHFKIILKVIDPAWAGGGYATPVPGGVPENPLGHRWMGLDLGGGGEYGVHGNNAPYSIGTNASHGCIRMINSDVEGLYEIVPEDTPVWIGNDNILENDGIAQPVY